MLELFYSSIISFIARDEIAPDKFARIMDCNNPVSLKDLQKKALYIAPFLEEVCSRTPYQQSEVPFKFVSSSKPQNVATEPISVLALCDIQCTQHTKKNQNANKMSFTNWWKFITTWLKNHATRKRIVVPTMRSADLISQNVRSTFNSSLKITDFVFGSETLERAEAHKKCWKRAEPLDIWSNSILIFLKCLLWWRKFKETK